MPFTEFLQLTKVLRMLYGHDYAISFFTKNIELYYNLTNISTKNVEKKVD